MYISSALAGAVRAGAAMMVLLVTSPARSETPRSFGLADALSLARARAVTVKVARESERSAEAAVSSAQAGYVPSLSASVSGTGSSARSTVPAPAGFFDLTVSSMAGQGQAAVSWTVWNFGQTSSQVRSAEALRRTATANRQQALLDAQKDAADAYLSLFYAQELLRVADASVEQRKQHVTLAQGLVARGVAPPVDELRASAALDAALVARVSAEGAVIAARATLTVLLALEPQATFVLETPPPLTARMTPEAAMAMAEQSRPDLAQSVATESSRDALVDAALAAYRPALAFAASGFYVLTYRDSDAFTRKSFGASGGLTMSVPLFDATLGPKLDDAKNDRAAATAVRLQTRVTVRTEARTAALLVERAASRAALAERAAASASEVVAITLARYEKGLAAPLELLTAEADDATARGARVQAAQARALSVVRLLAATGRLAMLGGS